MVDKVCQINLSSLLLVIKFYSVRAVFARDIWYDIGQDLHVIFKVLIALKALSGHKILIDKQSNNKQTATLQCLQSLCRKQIKHNCALELLCYQANALYAVAGSPDAKPWLAVHASWGGVDTCRGKFVRGVCVYGLGDLPSLVTRAHLFVNKFHLDYQPLALLCLEEWHRNRTARPDTRYFNETFYRNLPFINKGPPSSQFLDNSHQVQSSCNSWKLLTLDKIMLATICILKGCAFVMYFPLNAVILSIRIVYGSMAPMSCEVLQ